MSTTCSRSSTTIQKRESKSQHSSSKELWRLALKVDGGGVPPPKSAGARLGDLVHDNLLGDLAKDDLYLGGVKRVDLDESTESHKVRN